MRQAEDCLLIQRLLPTDDQIGCEAYVLKGSYQEFNYMHSVYIYQMKSNSHYQTLPERRTLNMNCGKI
jgi:hypothetical protein